MKAFTDIEQSKVLAKILPIESADMWWNFYSVTTDDTTPQIIHLDTPWVGNFNWDNKPDNIPCWSLAALLDASPKEEVSVSVSFGFYTSEGDYIKSYICCYEREAECTDDYIIITTTADNPIDACVELIIKLHKEKLL